MASLARYLGQGVVYGLLAFVLGYCSQSPDFTHSPPDMAMIKIGFSHGADRVEPCRQRTPEELQALPPNMRRPRECARERMPVVVELHLDGELLYRDSLPPTGLAKDGPSRVYQRFTVPPGQHELVARLRDSRREQGFDYEKRAVVDLAPQESLAIDFRPETGGFIFL